MSTLKISTEFTTAPGPRYISEGKFSGEQFRKDLLVPKLKEARLEFDTLTVDLDGTSGYGTAFLEEAFGGLIRHDGYDLISLESALEFKSDEEPDLIDEIEEGLRFAETCRIVESENEIEIDYADASDLDDLDYEA